MLKRRVFDNVKLMLSIDPSVDLDKSNFEEYYKTWDEKHIVIKEGEKPTIFTINQLTERQKNKILSIDNQYERSAMCIRCGLLDVENYFIEDKLGQSQPLESPKRAQFGDWGNIITDEWMDKARFLTDEKLSIGGAIYLISEARAPLS